MRFGSIIKVALRALLRNTMRSILTALGIIIGVGAVIAMVSIGNGAKSQVEAQVASLGQNVITVFSGSMSSGGMRGGWGSAVGRAGGAIAGCSFNSSLSRLAAPAPRRRSP